MRTVHALAAAAVVALFAWNVSRAWFVNDDAYISFRYAQNLVDGRGLVWNPGERVEGYTSLLWVLISAAGMALGVNPEILANVVSVLSGLGVLAAVWRYGARRFGESSLLVWFAPALLAANRTFTAWSSSGMEMQLCALLVLLGTLRFVREWERGERAPLRSALLFALAGLTRPDALLFGAVAGGALALGALRGRRAWLAVGAFALPFLLLNGSHFLWRRWYYGFWWPNTFYAKVSGFYFGRAYFYFRLFLRDYQLHWFLPLLLLLFRRPRCFDQALYAAMALAQLGYVFAIGGDWFAFRFLLPVLPLLYLLLVESLLRLAELGARASESGGARPFARALALAIGALLFGTTARVLVLPEADQLRDWVLSETQMRNYTRRRKRDGLLLRRLVDEGKLPPDLRIAVGGAGALPFFSRLHTFDVRGLNDVEVAHRPLLARGPVGHERSATRADLERRRIAMFDAMNDLFWPRRPEQIPWRTSPDPVDAGAPLRCLEVESGDLHGCLLFTTTLSEEEFRATFHAFKIAF